MSEAKIPAWKKVGLKQVKTSKAAAKTAYDPLKEGLKRSADIGETKKIAKPPKRQKVKKSEKPKATHELDQLLYLRTYTESRDTWKFSKQKQNWILKHLYDEAIAQEYDEVLLNYIDGLQGSAREWAVDDAKEIVKKWNDFMSADLNDKDEDTASESTTSAEPASKIEDSSVDAAPNKETEPTSNNSAKANTKKSSTDGKESQQPAESKIPTEHIAKRAQNIIKRVAGENITLELLDS